MNVKPLADRVLVKPLEMEETTTGGIVIPDTAKEKPQHGEVAAVGPGRYENGKQIPMNVSKGDRVIFAKYGGTEIKWEGEEYLIMKESDILAVVE